MLPNLKILICGVAFGPVLFAVTGAGVLLPDSNTHVGEMPEISRPMMQRVIADEPAQAQFHLLTLARRSEELERLRAQAAVEIAPAFAPMQLEPELVKPAATENPISEDAPASAVPMPQLPGTTGTAPDLLEVRQSDVPPDYADPVQVAPVLPISANSDQTERAPSLLNVPLPPVRPAVRRSGIRRYMLHRKDVITQVPPPYDTIGQVLSH